MARGVQVDPFEEREHVVAGVAFAGLGEDLAGGDVEGGEQVDGAVSLVVVGEGAVAARAHRQRRLGAVEGLYLGLFVEAEHHSALWRVHVQPDHVGELGLEVGIGGHLEHISEPRAQPPLAPGLGDEVLAHAVTGRHLTRRPARRLVRRRDRQGVGHDRGDHLVGHRPLAAPTRRHRSEPVRSRAPELVTPAANRVLVRPHLPSNAAHRTAVRQSHKRPRRTHPPPRLAHRTRHALQRQTLLNRQHKPNSHPPTIRAPTISQTNH